MDSELNLTCILWSNKKSELWFFFFFAFHIWGKFIEVKKKKNCICNKIRLLLKLKNRLKRKGLLIWSSCQQYCCNNVQEAFSIISENFQWRQKMWKWLWKSTAFSFSNQLFFFFFFFLCILCKEGIFMWWNI